MGKFLDSIREYNKQMGIQKDIRMLKDNGLFEYDKESMAGMKGLDTEEAKLVKMMSQHRGCDDCENDTMMEYAKADVEATQAYWESLEDLNKKGIYIDGQQIMADTRYNTPKEAPKASEELVEETIITTEIYRQARLAVVQSDFLNGKSRTAILEAQNKQVAYGIDKYPEPLNPNTWTINETVEHIMDESIDRLHYLIMLRIKLEQQLVSGAYNDFLEVRTANSRIVTISRMIDNTIEELHYLVTLCIDTDRELEACRNDSIDAVAYAVNTNEIIGASKLDISEGIMWSKAPVVQLDGKTLDMKNSGMDGDRTITIHPSGVKVTPDELRVFTDDELEELAAKKEYE